MTATPSHRRGMYFEEFEVGQRVITPARTITEADIVNFAGLTGDYNLIHTDAVYAQGTPFGQRVAHGILGLAMASGLATRTGILEATVLAFREITEWKFSRPVFIGDTVWAELVVEETKALPRLGGGSLLLAVEVKKQDGEVVMKGRWSILVQSRPADSPLS
ncbi:MAG: MaoC/PaaZ C-terminal domain-containing protein [Chloroflexota bacterium]